MATTQAETGGGFTVANGEPERDKKGRFVKGNREGAGNNGRRKRAPWTKLLAEATVGAWPEILATCVQMAKDGDIHAMRFLADHLWGKAPMRVEHSGAAGGPIIIERHVPRPNYDDGDTDTD